MYIERPVITRLRAVSLFSLDLVKELNARASVERDARNEGSALSHARDHLRVSRVLLDEIRKKSRLLVV